MTSWVYILRLRSGSLYIGACRDLRHRFGQHLRGEGSRQTSLDPPVAIAYAEEHTNFVTARRREAQLKRWSRAKKEALIAGDLAQLHALARRRKR